MTENETTSGGAVWRKRAVASVSVAAAVCAMGVGFASAANAATAPTLTVTAPTSVSNDGTNGGNQLFTLEVNTTGADAIPPTTTPNKTTAQYVFNFTVPAGISCTSVKLAPNKAASIPTTRTLGNITLAGNGTACTASVTPPAQDANTDVTYAFNLTVGAAVVGQTGVTGSLTSQVNLVETVAGSATVVAGSNTATSTLASPASPAFSAAPPAGTIYQPYSATVLSSTGTPSTPTTNSGTARSAAKPAAAAGYAVFAAPTAKVNNAFQAGKYITATTKVTNPTTGLADNAIALNDGLALDLVTGTIVGTPQATNATPAFIYTIIANNGEGGATQPSAGNPAGGTTVPATPQVFVHDVDSAPFSIPVLFSDVATTSTFGTDIYGLSDVNAIKGFFDGTFRPGQAVTRAEFVNILVHYDPQIFGVLGGTGECTTIEPSAFSDVPNSSVFCEAIKVLSQDGVINGTGGGKFSPSAVVSRQEITAFAYRAFAYASTKNVNNGDAKFTAPSPFKDVSANNVFAGDIQWAAKNGVVKGYTDGTFRPQGQTNRDATAAIIFRTGLTFPK